MTDNTIGFLAVAGTAVGAYNFASWFTRDSRAPLNGLDGWRRRPRGFSPEDDDFDPDANYDDPEEFEDDEASNQWAITEREMSKRAPRCRREYDLIAKMIKRDRKNPGVWCQNGNMLYRAAQESFGGNCRKALRLLGKAGCGPNWQSRHPLINPYG